MKLSKLIAPVYKDVKNAIFNNTHRKIVLKGGRSSAKGDTAYTLACLLCNVSELPIEVRVFVPQVSIIRNGVEQQILKVIERIGITAELNRSTHTFTFDNGSRIIISGLHVGRTINEDILKGGDTSLAGGVRLLIFDELGAVKDFKIISTLERTYTRHENLQIIEISNPPTNAKQPIAKRYEQQEKSNSTLVLHTTIYDITKEWTTKRQWEDIEELKTNDNISYRHEILGEMVGVDGLLINRDDLMFISESELSSLQFYKTIAVIDTKSTGADYFVCGIIGITGNGEYVLRDVLRTNEVLSDKLLMRTINLCNSYNVHNTFIEVNKDYSIYLYMKDRINNRVHKFHSTMNKHQKILMYADDIKRMIYVNTDDQEYNGAIENILLYDIDEKENKQIHDDEIDMLAMAFKLCVENKNKLGLK